MFPKIPANLSSLSDAELATLRSECVTAYQTARPDATTPEAVQALSAFADGVNKIRSEQDSRVAAAAETAETLAALDAQFAVTEPEPQPDAEPESEPGDGGHEHVEPDDDQEAEGADGGAGTDEELAAEELVTLSADQIAELVEARVAAAVQAAIPARARRPVAVRASIADLAARRPEQQGSLPVPDRNLVTITAGGDIPGVTVGSSLDRMELANAMIRRSNDLGRGRGGPDDKVVVASLNLNRGEDRTLSPGDYNMSNERKIRDAIEERESIIAAGGLCAPVNPYYEQQVISTDARPVRDAIPAFTVDRGGLRFNPPPSLSSITSGVAAITAAADLASGAGAVKGCFIVTCPGIIESDVEADYVCMQFGNFGARTFPEQVDAWMKLAAAAHARAADGNRLTDIKTASTAATSAGLVGAAREILTRLEQAAEGIRSAQRMLHGAPIEVILPQWVFGLMRADLARTFSDDTDFLGITDADIGALFAARNLAVTLTPDSASGNGQVFTAEAGGVLDNYPSTVYGEVFAPGSFLYLDNGRLDLGLVRDSILTMGDATHAGNQFRMFYENFEALAHVGVPAAAVEVAMAVCPDGSYGAAKSVTCPIVT